VPEPFACSPASERFELASRGDFVPARLWRAVSGAPPFPLALIVPALGCGKDAPEVDALARALAAAGVVAAALDLPLQGERASAKLSARLAAAAARAALEGADRFLVDEFRRQSALDLAAARAALGQRVPLDASRVACAAFAPDGGAAEAFAAAAPEVRVVRTELGGDAARLAAALRRDLAR
jgi:hypothetical protein